MARSVWRGLWMLALIPACGGKVGAAADDRGAAAPDAAYDAIIEHADGHADADGADSVVHADAVSEAAVPDAADANPDVFYPDATPGECAPGVVCGPDEFCFYDIAAPCGWGGASGTCQPRPDCKEYTVWHPPACGCDGKLYELECGAYAAGVAASPKMDCMPGIGESLLVADAESSRVRIYKSDYLAGVCVAVMLRSPATNTSALSLPDGWGIEFLFVEPGWGNCACGPPPIGGGIKPVSNSGTISWQDDANGLPVSNLNVHLKLTIDPLLGWMPGDIAVDGDDVPIASDTCPPLPE